MKKLLALTMCVASFFVANAQTVSLYAGWPDSANHNPVGTTRLAGFLNKPWGMAYDSRRNLWISNSGGHTITMISSDGNSMYTRAGNYGNGCFSNQNGVNARFNVPSGLAVGPGDTIFVADHYNHVIRKITPFTTLANVQAVSVKAGKFSFNLPMDPCYTHYEGYVNGAANVAQFRYPVDVAVDGSGNIYVVDQGNHCIRKITPGGMVTSFAGQCTKPGYRDHANKDSAKFNYPAAVIIAPNGDLYVADQFNSKVRKVASTGVSTVNTHDSAWSPGGLLLSSTGALFITDNHKILRNTSTNTNTFVGGWDVNDRGYANGNGMNAKFDYTKDILFDPVDNNIFYVADMDNHVIRKVINCTVYSPTVNATKTSFCLGDSAILSVSGSYSNYLWSNGKTTSTIVVKTTNNYTVTVTNANGCPGTSAPKSIVTTPISPNVTPNGPLTFCTGDSVLLVGEAGLNTYKWYRNSVLIKQGTQGVAQTLTVKTAGDYYLEGTSGPCTGTSSHFIVNVGSVVIPDVTILGDSVICPGDTIMLETKNTYSTYQWKNGVNVVGTSRRIIVAAAGSYTVSVTQAGGCSGTSVPVNVTVHPAPVKPVININDTILTSSSANSYQWYKNGQKITGATNQVYRAPRNAVYKVQTTDVNGCKSMSDPVTIGTVSVNNADNNQVFTLFPNPGNGQLQFRVSQNQENITLMLTNMYGAKVYSWSGSIKVNAYLNIDLSHLPAGIYFATMGVGSELLSQKIVIQK